MKVLLFGARGQLGTDLRATAPKGFEVAGVDHVDADIADMDAVSRLLDRHKPLVVLNAAAYNLTEKSETHPEIAFSANAAGPAVVARLCPARGLRLIHFSTDFVFDGSKALPYVESDLPNPLSQYGKSKWEGEKAVLKTSPDFIVVRSATLFGKAGSCGKGGNFVESVLSKASAGEPLSVIDDIRMSPTYTRDLAQRTWQMIQRGVPGGLYHVVNDGSCTWFEFAREILRQAGVRAVLAPVAAKDWPGAMRRPPHSALASGRGAALGLSPLRPWGEALSAYLVETGRVRAPGGSGAGSERF